MVSSKGKRGDPLGRPDRICVERTTGRPPPSGRTGRRSFGPALWILLLGFLLALAAVFLRFSSLKPPPPGEIVGDGTTVESCGFDLDPFRIPKEGDRVIGIVAGGRARAYPLRVLAWHEVVNDTLGGVPVRFSFTDNPPTVRFTPEGLSDPPLANFYCFNFAWHVFCEAAR